MMLNFSNLAVAFRVDAGAQIGSGHIMRTLTLADALKREGALVRFVSRQMPLHFRLLLGDRGHDFVALTEPGDTPPVCDLAHSSWLGTSQSCDATETALALSDRRWDWLVVDHYALDCRWETPMRARTNRIMAIDDLADRVHDCDILLDQNLVADHGSRYVGKIPTACRALLGPHYALLQPIYAEMHVRARPRRHPIRRILMFFGAADCDNLTGRSIAAFLQLQRTEIDVDVVLGTDNPHIKLIKQQVSGLDTIHLHVGLASLAPLMAAADLAIGACGATSWERLCVGLPALVITLADNQRPVASYLHTENLVHWIGDKDEADEPAIARALELMLQDVSLTKWSCRCLQVCDGLGAQKVSQVMINLSMSNSAKPYDMISFTNLNV